ncbi:MAG: hypothetical protein GY771_15385 [bacterium]|nr:hypothetical protein [bacterium]
MATHRIPIHLGLVPDDSGEVYWVPFNVEAINDVWKNMVLVFADSSTRNGAYAEFVVPENYSADAAFIVNWTANATSGSVEQDIDLRAVGGNDTESLDQSGTQESLNVADVAPSAVFERLQNTLTATDGNFQPGDTVLFGLFRDGTDAGDTMAANMLVFEVLFEYTD